MEIIYYIYGMKYLLSIICLFISFTLCSQTLVIDMSNEYPELSNVIKSDTIMVDYNMAYDTLTCKEMDLPLMLSFVEVSCTDEEGFEDICPLKRKDIKDKVVILYSSEWKVSKVIHKPRFNN
jgi:hypothetical protein